MNGKGDYEFLSRPRKSLQTRRVSKLSLVQGEGKGMPKLIPLQWEGPKLFPVSNLKTWLSLFCVVYTRKVENSLSFSSFYREAEIPGFLRHVCKSIRLFLVRRKPFSLYRVSMRTWPSFLAVASPTEGGKGIKSGSIATRRRRRRSDNP